MEDVLDLYAAPYDPRRPVVCFDELPYQLLRDAVEPHAGTPGRPRREDYEYKREGTCNLFISFQPLQGWRHVDVTAHRTAQDFAHQMQALVDVHFPDADVIRGVVDNLNTHTPAALYQTFPPAQARRLTEKLEFHYTPKHGSWLNMVEIELSVLARQWLDQRLPDGIACSASSRRGKRGGTPVGPLLIGGSPFMLRVACPHNINIIQVKG